MSEPGTAVDDLFEYITEICFIVLMYDGQLCCGSTLKVKHVSSQTLSTVICNCNLIAKKMSLWIFGYAKNLTDDVERSSIKKVHIFLNFCVTNICTNFSSITFFPTVSTCAAAASTKPSTGQTLWLLGGEPTSSPCPDLQPSQWMLFSSMMRASTDVGWTSRILPLGIFRSN